MVPKREVGRLTTLLRALNPEARIHVTKESRVAPKEVVGTGRFSMERAARAAGWIKVGSPYIFQQLHQYEYSHVHTYAEMPWQICAGAALHAGLLACITLICLLRPVGCMCPALAAEACAQGMGAAQTLQEGEVVTPETEEYGIASFVYRARRPFHPGRLHAFVAALFTLQQPDYAEALASDEGGHV